MSVSGVFVCYRRQDSAADAGRIVDSLKGKLGKGKVFRDIDAIRPGTDFVDAIERALDHCSAFVAVIGPHWLDAQDATGRRRLDNPKDFIRRELAFALQQQVRVVPALVQGAEMPEERDLPEDLRPLRRIQAIELSDPRWDYDMGCLVRAIQGRRRHLGPWLVAALAAALFVAAGATAYWLWPDGGLRPGASSPVALKGSGPSEPPVALASLPVPAPDSPPDSPPVVPSDQSAPASPDVAPTRSSEPGSPPPPSATDEPFWQDTSSSSLSKPDTTLAVSGETGPVVQGSPAIVSIPADHCPLEDMARDLCAPGDYARRDLPRGWMLTRDNLFSVTALPPTLLAEAPLGRCLGAAQEAGARIGNEQVDDCAPGYYARRRIEPGWMLLSAAVKVLQPVPMEIEYLEGLCFNRDLESGEPFDPEVDTEGDCPGLAYSSDDLRAGARLAERHLDGSYGARWRELLGDCLVHDVLIGEPLDSADVTSCG